MGPNRTLASILLAPFLPFAAAFPALAQVPAQAQAPVAAPAQAAAPAMVGQSSPLTFAIIEWKIKKGMEKDFLDYWATKSTLADRTGLVGEFLSSEGEATGQFPWINWQTRSTPEYTVYYNVGIWKSSKDYVEQIGKFADNSRSPMPFEYDHRRRVLVDPVEWRRGPVALPDADAPGVR